MSKRKKISELVEWYRIHSGRNVNLFTFYKRRKIAGLGIFERGKWYLTEDEFIKVLNTPLFDCRRVKEKW